MSKPKKDFDFSQRADSYDKGLEGRMSRRFYDLLQREIKFFEGARLLDVGCGTGALIRRLLGDSKIEAYGIDANASMISVAKRQCPGCSFQVATCEKIPFADASLDILTACMAYHHFSDKAGFAQEAARVLKPGGVLYVADPKFPHVIRKSLNGILRLFRVVGEFYTAQEIGERFLEYGFSFSGAAYNGYAQAVTLTRI